MEKTPKELFEELRDQYDFVLGGIMSYTITITQTEVQEVESGGDWTVIEKRPLTEEEADKTFSTARSQLKTVYGYTPKIIKSGIVTTEIYKQTVEKLDLPAVIRAVNEL